jgi:hypothetical protein
VVNQNVVWLGAAAMVWGTVVCVRDVSRGRARPNLVTWLMWTLVPAIALVAQLRVGVAAEAVLTFTLAACPAAVVLATLGRSRWAVAPFDICCGSLAAAALVMWWLTGEPSIAILLSIAADLVAAVPTLVKAYRQPRSENALVYATFVLSAATTLLAVRAWTIENAAFAIYVLTVYSGLFLLIRQRSAGAHRAGGRAVHRPRHARSDITVRNGLITRSTGGLPWSPNERASEKQRLRRRSAGRSGDDLRARVRL